MTTRNFLVIFLAWNETKLNSDERILNNTKQKLRRRSYAGCCRPMNQNFSIYTFFTRNSPSNENKHKRIFLQYIFIIENYCKSCSMSCSLAQQLWTFYMSSSYASQAKSVKNQFIIQLMYVYLATRTNFKSVKHTSVTTSTMIHVTLTNGT